jgi:hypothetical protein
MIQFDCPTCSSPLQASDAEAGSKVLCHRCNQRVLVPPPVAAAVAGQPQEQSTVIRPLSVEELSRPLTELEPVEPQRPSRPGNPPQRYPSREEEEPRSRRRSRRDEDDEYDIDRRRRRRYNDGPRRGPEDPGGAAITGLVLSCVGGCFGLLWPLFSSTSLVVALVAALGFSLAGLISSLCGRDSLVRTLGIVFGALGLSMALLVYLSFPGIFRRPF